MAQFAVELAGRIDQLAGEIAKLEGETRASAIRTAKQRVLAEEKANDQIRIHREKTNRAMSQSGAKSARDTGRSLKEIADEAGDADSILKGLGGSLGTLSDDADKAAGTLGEAFAGLEAVAKVGAKMGPIGAAGAAGIAALGGAYAALNFQLDQAIARQTEAAETADKAATAHRAYEDAVLDLDVAVGNLTEAERRNIKLRQQAAGVFDEQKQALREQIEQTQIAADAHGTLGQSARTFIADWTPYGLLMESSAERTERLTKKADSLKGQLANLERGTGNLADKLIETADAEEEATKKREAATRATQARAQAEREAEQAEAAHAARLRDLAAQLDAVEQANATAADASRARLDARNAELGALESALAAEGMLTAEAADEILVARLNAEHAYQDDQDKLRQERESAIQAEADKAIAEAERVAKARQDLQRAEIDMAREAAAIAQTIADEYIAHRLETARDLNERLSDEDSNLTDLQRKHLQERAAEEQKAANRVYRLSQSLAVAQAGVTAALSALVAIGPPPTGYGPTPPGFVAAGLAAAAGGVAIGKIAATPPPKAHSGYQDESVRVVQSGEGIVSRAAMDRMGGSQVVNQQRSVASQPPRYVLQLNARTLGNVQVQALGQPKVREAMRGRGRPGQRLRT